MGQGYNHELTFKPKTINKLNEEIREGDRERVNQRTIPA